MFNALMGNNVQRDRARVSRAGVNAGQRYLIITVANSTSFAAPPLVRAPIPISAT